MTDQPPMTTKPLDGRRKACNELAQLLRQPEALKALRLLQRTALLSPAAVAGRRAAGDPAEGGAPARAGEPRPVSIWQPEERPEGRVFVRPEPGPFGDHYAPRREIPAKAPEGRKRLCLFGESVAAGYLYAPDLTPAMVLSHLLGRGWEVVDLSRTNETLEGLAGTVEASRQLAPDVLVYFGGNNWNLLETPEVSVYRPSVSGRQRLAEALGAAGPGGLSRVAEKRLERAVRSALKRVSLVARDLDIPAVLVIPEVNLRDWESRQPVHWLPGDGVERWYRWLREGEELLEDGDGEGCEALARRMIELDGGLCPTSHRLLARALELREAWPECEEACRAEIDAESYASLCLLGAPRVTTLARRLLLEGAREGGFRVVDLRPVFREELIRLGEAPLPGRRHFLDYCHLTAEGMGVAMAAVAGAVPGGRGGHDGSPVSPEELAPVLAEALAEVPATTEATAFLGAAIHTAHRWAGDKRGLLEYWCRRSLDAFPGTLEAVADLVDARAAPLPAVLTAAQARNAARPAPLGFQHGWRWKGLDVEVLEAVLGLLRERGGPEAEELRGRLVDRLGLSSEPVELTRERHLWDPLLRFFPEVMELAGRDRRGTLRSPWPVSEFAFVAGGGGLLELEICARLGRSPTAEEGARPERRKPGQVIFRVNGERFGAAEVGVSWCRRTLKGRVRATASSIHRLSLEWPMPPPGGEVEMEKARQRLELGIEADLHPVFGELWSLRARLH